MTRQAVTVVIIISKGSGEVGPDTVVLGVPLLRRMVMVASRAGCQDILVVDDGSFGCGKLLEGTNAVLMSPTRLAGHRCVGRILVLASNMLPHPSLLTDLSETLLHAETVFMPMRS